MTFFRGSMLIIATLSAVTGIGYGGLLLYVVGWHEGVLTTIALLILLVGVVMALLATDVHHNRFHLWD